MTYECVCAREKSEGYYKTAAKISSIKAEYSPEISQSPPIMVYFIPNMSKNIKNIWQFRVF